MNIGPTKYNTEFIARIEVMAASGMRLWDIDCELKLPLGTAGRLINSVSIDGFASALDQKNGMKTR